MVETPTAATMRLDGGHPALDLVNTIYGQVGGPVEHDVLTAPDDLVTFARRVGLAGEATPASEAAWRAAVALRDALDPVLRAPHDPPAEAREAVENAARAALGSARLGRAEGGRPDGRSSDPTEGGPSDPAEGGASDPSNGAPRRGLVWVWPQDDPMTPVHRLAHEAAALLTDPAAMALLHTCAGCCWMYLDRSRNRSRRWCSMADCGTEAKKRRYVAKRRAARG